MFFNCILPTYLVCNFTCSKSSGLLVHMQVHTLEKAVACPNCGYGYANNTKFYDHCVRQIKGKFIYLS
jgi:DNA-directed RNA polymerase subunit M/transcription elongation factor TFIIS